MSRRSIQVFSMSFLSVMTNFLGAAVVLFLVAGSQKTNAPGGEATSVIFNGQTQEIFGKIDPNALKTINEGDTLTVVVKKKI